MRSLDRSAYLTAPTPTAAAICACLSAGRSGAFSATAAVSRHGMLPQVHRGLGGPPDAFWLPALSDTGGPVRLPELIWQVRSAMASRPNHWQDVVDAVRPHVPSLWRRLPDRDKRLFVRHVARYWEVHRHRMPPATARRLTELRCTGRLSVLPGRASGIT